jgi:hypothetical protein
VDSSVLCILSGVKTLVIKKELEYINQRINLEDIVAKDL